MSWHMQLGQSLVRLSLEQASATEACPGCMHHDVTKCLSYIQELKLTMLNKTALPVEFEAAEAQGHLPAG